MTTTETCGWDTGTVYTGPVICGKPAKFVALDGDFGTRRLVCGVHARSARRFGDTVTPIESKD